VCDLDALTPAQQSLVTQNLGLVSHVIETCVSLPCNHSVYDYNDLYQIGCRGLCKAAATTTGKGKFSTYAYKVIRNEIYNALIYATYRTHSRYIENMQGNKAEEMEDSLSVQARPDIAKSVGVSVNSLRACISVARKYLKQHERFQKEIV